MFLLGIVLVALVQSASAVDTPCKRCVHQKIWWNRTGYADYECDPDYPDNPDETNECAYDTFNQVLDKKNFFAKLCTNYIAPANGLYTFYLACDNLCVLWIDGNKVLNIWPATGDPQEYLLSDEQKTPQIYFTAGQCVEICALVGHGCTNTTDHLSVAVNDPNDAFDGPLSKNIVSSCPNTDVCTDPSNPCQNGGTCEFDLEHETCYTCNCTSKCYTGEHCDIEDNTQCISSNPCQNGGNCEFDDTKEDCFKCNCDHTCYTGDLCDTENSPCTDDSCLNNGVCSFNGSMDGCYQCKCSSCFTGAYCDTPVDHCTDTTCLNGGTCEFDGDSDSCFQCYCANCYSGDTCDTADAPCTDNPCGDNGGNCTFDPNSSCCYTCSCPKCYSGDDCEKPDNPCDNNNPCNNGGTCTYDPDADSCYKCHCHHCYSGENCDEENSGCTDDNCPNQGECRFDDTAALCRRCDGCVDLRENCSASECISLNDSVSIDMANNCRKTCGYCCACEGACDIPYKKVACIKNTGSVFTEQIETQRGAIDWPNYEFRQPTYVCDCAQAAKAKGYSWFGLVFYGECWSGPDDEVSEKMESYTSGTQCTGRGFDLCDGGEDTWDHNGKSQPPHYCCVGKARYGYVYKIQGDFEIDTCEQWSSE